MKKISIDQINQLANYLAKMPYVEVFKLIEMLTNLEDFDSEVKSSEEK